MERKEIGWLELERPCSIRREIKIKSNSRIYALLKECLHCLGINLASYISIIFVFEIHFFKNTIYFIMKNQAIEKILWGRGKIPLSLLWFFWLAEYQINRRQTNKRKIKSNLISCTRNLTHIRESGTPHTWKVQR